MPGSESGAGIRDSIVIAPVRFRSDGDRIRLSGDVGNLSHERGGARCGPWWSGHLDRSDHHGPVTTRGARTWATVVPVALGLVRPSHTLHPASDNVIGASTDLSRFRCVLARISRGWSESA